MRRVLSKTAAVWPDCINIVRLGNQNISLRWHADTQQNWDFQPRTVLCQPGGGHINIWRHLAGNVFKRNRQTLKCASFLLFMPIGVISATCVYFLEYLEGSYAFFLSIVPYILNEGSLFFCKYVFMFILHPLYTVYNKTCQLQRCLSKNESMSELFAIPFCLEINCHCENLLTVRAKPIVILLSHFTGCWAAGAQMTFARGIYMDILLDEKNCAS